MTDCMQREFPNLKITLYTSSPAITADLQQLSPAFKLSFCLTSVKVLLKVQNPDLDISELREQLFWIDH